MSLERGAIAETCINYICLDNFRARERLPVKTRLSDLKAAKRVPAKYAYNGQMELTEDVAN